MPRRRIVFAAVPALLLGLVVWLAAKSPGCVPVEPSEAAACTDAECGPAPECPTYDCADGSVGGCTGQCLRDSAGQCGWEVRTCPAELQWYETCGDPVCRGWTDSGLPRCATETVGASCSEAGALCDPVDLCNAHLLCADADPRLQGCPISRAAYKQDVRYLGAADRDRLRDELLRFRLATYRYRGAPEREHLGFVIEDEEPSAAIDSPRDQVDLYGYTSMAVAALQAQADEISALRREVGELRARLDAQAH
jgi:hypothetical protein